MTVAMESDTNTKRAILSKLASTLGVPIERFFSDARSPETRASEEECLRLWSRIRTDEGRRQALKALRMIAELEQP